MQNSFQVCSLVDWFVKIIVWYSVRVSCHLDCEFTYIPGWLKSRFKFRHLK